jgi:hypothetical protein
LELRDQETALGMVKAAHALPQMGELGADAVQTEMAAAKAFRGAVKETTGALETAHTAVQAADRGAMVVGLATGVGGLAQAGRAVLMQGGKAALARWAAREGAKLAAGVAVDQSGVLDEAEAQVYAMSGFGPEHKEAVAGVIGVLKAIAEKRGNRRMTADQAALVELAKEAKKKGVRKADAETLLEWAKETGLPGRGPEAHPTREFKDPHIHVGPVDHIKVWPNEP